MKIGIDCRLWNQTGVGRYTRNLVSNLVRIDKNNEYVLFVLEEDINDLRAIVDEKRWSIIPVNIKWHGIAEQLRFPKILNEQNLDLVHFPYFSVPFFYYKPFIVTIHDIIINKFKTGKASTLPYPIYLAKRAGYHAVLANAVYRSKKIIVPSNAVRGDLISEYRNINPNKINVVYEGGFDTKFKIQNSKFKIQEKYLLRVGNYYPHKNVEGLINAFKNFTSESGQDAKLILAGKKDYFSKRIEELVENLQMQNNIIFIENPTDEQLVNLYNNAVATIIPSFMEGFSLTAIEAMSQNCPVLVSDIPVHREVCGNSVIYCNPKDVNDIKQKIDFVFSLTDSSRRELKDQGKRQSAKFSWEKMAKETLQVYRATLG